MNTLRTTTALLISAAALTFAASAIASGGQDHKPKYGGIMVEGKQFDAELVAKTDSMMLYVSDHGKTVSIKGATATVTLLNGTTKSQVELKPADDGSKFQATGAYTVAKGTKAVAVVTLAGKKATTFRFEVK